MTQKIRRSSRGAALVGVLAATALGLSACAGGAMSAVGGDQASGPIKIGLLLPTSGVYAPISADMKAGFELYLEENGGKMGGRDVELIIEDTEATPEVGLRKAKKLLEEDNVDFGTGIVSSSVALQVASVFEESETPLVVSNAFAGAVTGEAKSDFVFRTSQSSHQLSYPVGKWIKDQIGDESLFLTASDYTAGHELVDGVRAGFLEAGGKIAGEAFPPFQKTQDYQPYLSQITASNAAASYAFYAGAEAVNFVKQYDQFGLKDKVKLIGQGSVTTPDVLPAQGDSAEGVLAVLPYAWTLDSPRNKEFVTAYRAKTDRPPSFYALFSYDAAQLIGQAVEKANGNVSDGASVAASMEGAKIDSPRGPLTIDPENHGTVQQIYIARIEKVEGELAPVVIAELGEFGEQPKK